MHLAPLIRDLAVILAVAGLVTLIFQRIRQPVVLGYIIAGLIVGPHTPPQAWVTDLPSIRIWAELGIIFLMFSLGLEFSFRKLAKVGGPAGFTALFEVAFMTALGALTGRALGWSGMDSVFLGAMLSISSTTIILRALDELKLKTRRFAETIFAVLIVEDLVAILLLVALGAIAGPRAFSGMALLAAAGQLVLVVSGWFLAGYFVVPRLVRYVGRTGSDEMLTNVALGLCLVLVVFAAHFHYSSALGAFIMGSILAESSESRRIEERIEPLRDVFAAVFFVSVGMLIDLRVIRENLGVVTIITAVTIAGKVVSTTVGSLASGQTLRTSVQIGFGLAQIGEFSFIIATLGLSLGVISSRLYPIAVAVSVVTTFATPYLIRVSHRSAVAIEEALPPRVTLALSRYAAWMQESRGDSAARRAFYRKLARWVINGLVCSVIFVAGRELLGSRSPSAIVAWALMLVFSAPFAWGMFQALRGSSMLLLFRLLASLWLGALSLEFFAPLQAMAITAAYLAIFIVLFYRQLESAYAWFERGFLSAFENEPKSRKPLDMLRALAPWDAHLVRLKVHPNAEIVGRPVSESMLRDRTGVNIVAIQRGLRTLVAPKPVELILPKDELLVLGTDEQVEAARPWIEAPPGLAERFHPITDYELRPLTIGATSGLAGKSIRESGIRERFDAMVVGVERDRERISNPRSDLRLRAGDRLWVVGQLASLQKLENHAH